MTNAPMPPTGNKENSAVLAALQKSSADGSSSSSGVENYYGNAVAVITAHKQQQLAPTTTKIATACPPMSKDKIICSFSVDGRKAILAFLSDLVATTAELPSASGHRKGASLLGGEHVSMVGQTMTNEYSDDGFNKLVSSSSSEGCGCTTQARTEGLSITHGDYQNVNRGAASKRKRETSDRDDEDGASSPKKRAAAQIIGTNSHEQWPLTNILTPGSNDCLIGLGRTGFGTTGNRKYRYLVGRKEKYRNANHLDNAMVAMEVVNEWRAMTPPGRFLEQDKDSLLWNDVGDKRAKKKVITALFHEKTKSRDALNKIPKGGSASGMKMSWKKLAPLPPSYPPPGYFIHHEWPKLEMRSEMI